MKYVYFDFPSGEVYRYPAKRAAEDRARYYAEKDHPNDVEAQKEAKRAEVDFALSNELELFDWVKGNMSWEDDIKPHATRVEGPTPDDKGDYYNTANLSLRDVDPTDDPDKPDGTPPGIYLVNATGEQTALATEDGSGDRALLRDALADHDVGTFAAASNYPDVRRYAKDEIAVGDTTKHGAPVADVIEAVADEFTLGKAFDVLRDLHRTGEIYAPRHTTLRRTTIDDGDTDE